MPTKSSPPIGLLLLAASLLVAVGAGSARAQERLPWLRDDRANERSYEENGSVDRKELPPAEPVPYNSAPRAGAPVYGGNSSYEVGREDVNRPSARYGYDPGRERSYSSDEAYHPPPRAAEPYDPPRAEERHWQDDRHERYEDRYASSEPPYVYDREPPPRDGTFAMHEIVHAGHGFFGSVSKGLASVIEYAFRTQGRPNGYILGEDVGGAFVAGLRYGEGRLYTRDAGTHKVYWQGPSLGYDAGAEGSKVMVLVYNIRDPWDVYQRFGGVAGSAYVVGGVGLTFQQRGDIVLAPIRAGVGFRLGANVGYLKYTRRPTWNPF